mgnify:CR=1 FL=1
MNYEEMLSAREAAGGKGTDVPIGVLRQTQIAQKFRYVVVIKHTLADSADFRQGLEDDHAWALKHAGKHQLQYEIGPGDTLQLELGTYQTLAQLLDSNPAIVATQGFVEQVVAQLMDHAIRLHAEGVCQLCFAPQNIFLRKGSTTPMLLCHGSFYAGVRDVKTLYEGCEQYVAPEVLQGAKATEASDVYSLGKLIEHLFGLGGMTIEYKMLLRKATAEDPEARFRNVEEMKASLAQKRNVRRSLMTVIAAVAIALLCVWIYIGLVPQRSDIEFIEPAKKDTKADPYDEPFSPDAQMIFEGDTINITEEDMQMYTQKAEQIFRRRFEEAAEEKLSAIFDKVNMGANEKLIMADSKVMNNELEELKSTLAEDMGISGERAEEIAKEVIEAKMAKKKQEMENERKERAKE